MDDSKIVSLFFERSEKAVAELSKKYGRLCMRISENILGNTHDAEECVNETYSRVWSKIPPEKPQSLSAYVSSLARNISLDRYRHDHMKKRDSSYDICLDEIESSLFDSGGLNDDMTDNEISSVINSYISRLGKTDRTIIVRRFWELESYDEIAKATGLSRDAVYMRMSRIKAGLKKHLIKKGAIK